MVAFSASSAIGFAPAAQAQSALDAAHDLARMLDAPVDDLSGDSLLSALEDAAAAGQPMALWQLGLMYESGMGVEQNPGKAFQFFAQLASDNANAPPQSLDADIVAQSFLKVGEYYRRGVPDAGVAADEAEAHKLIYHAAVYFGDADAQYQLFLSEQENGYLINQSIRWLVLAARKGHPAAQARLGDILFSGAGVDPQPVEGLMWLGLGYRRALGTSDETWIRELNEGAMAQASSDQIAAAQRAAETLGPQFDGY
ncbi:tetratricopeptide repeat protein [Pelagibacterium montanilacus]|uniref:tetratricopeptide repeat protein n=1 Tax=Pelagibacterium montanilacus TaxID=2185280 RepID=UPI0013E08C32|nr:tetratricopeptide repeat protein [Pelagibacterium montanilacus]